MAQIIPFPGVSLPAPPPAPVSPATPTDFPIVRHIRGGRVRKKNRDEDSLTISVARLARIYAEKVAASAMIDPDSKDARFNAHMAGIGEQLPRNNLRCIVSTLDEERDFELRCAEAEFLYAEYIMEDRRADVIGAREGGPWWDSPVRKQMVEANRKRWDAYRDALMVVAETPARKWPQLERKVRIIGKMLLGCKGEWNDRLRAAVAADEAWLAENRPKRARKGKPQ